MREPAGEVLLLRVPWPVFGRRRLPSALLRVCVRVCACQRVRVSEWAGVWASVGVSVWVSRVSRCVGQRVSQCVGQ